MRCMKKKSYILDYIVIIYEMLHVQTLQSLRAFLESPKIEPTARALVEKVIGSRSYLVCDDISIVINVISLAGFYFNAEMFI